MTGEQPRPQPKPRPRALEQDAKRAARETLDKKESAKARKRACGRCECVVDDRTPFGRCIRRAVETHHLKGGNGRRGRGKSALAIWKLRCCTRCHQLITARVLVPVDKDADATRIVYNKRVRVINP